MRDLDLRRIGGIGHNLPDSAASAYTRGGSMRSPIRRARLWILALVPLLAPLYSCAGAGGGARAVNCDIVRLQRQEGLPPSQIAARFQASEHHIAKCPTASPAAEAAPPPVA